MMTFWKDRVSYHGRGRGPGRGRWQRRQGHTRGNIGAIKTHASRQGDVAEPIWGAGREKRTSSGARGDGHGATREHGGEAVHGDV